MDPSVRFIRGAHPATVSPTSLVGCNISLLYLLPKVEEKRKGIYQ